MEARIIIDRLGQEQIARSLGVSRYSVRNARTAGSFPASWFDHIDRMCAAEGIGCPRSAFNFKSPVDGASCLQAQHADPTPAAQPDHKNSEGA